MDKRFILFMVLAVGILAANQIVMSIFFPPDPAAKVAKKDAAGDKAKQAAQKENDKAAPEQPDDDAAKPDESDPPADAAVNDAVEKGADVAAGQDEPAIESARVALGSGDPNSPYRMLVYLTNDGAAIERLDMNSPRYRDLDNRSGYLGYLAPITASQRRGALVRVVGPGTPADVAGVKPGDIITAVGDDKVTRVSELMTALATTEPGQKIQVTVLRDGETVTLTALPEWQPLSVIRPEHDTDPLQVVTPGNHDPLSFLMTIEQFDDRTTNDGGELQGVGMRTGRWEVVAANHSLASFRKRLPALGLEVTKTYRLAEVPADQRGDADYPAYSLLMDVSLANVGDAVHKVAYQLDGPTGLPTEGYWYSMKVSRNWGSAGMRDVVARFEDGKPTMVTTTTIAADDFDTRWTSAPLDFAAVDAQYFSVALIPRKRDPQDIWFAEVKPIRVGAVPEDKALIRLTDVSFRLVSEPVELAPGGQPLEHHFEVFAGPKNPLLLAEYETANPSVSLRELVYYGWFGVVARPMVGLLHMFHSLVGNWGLAIIMLTVLVRGCMFPLSRKQALSAQKMQALQPEMKRIQEKYKNDAQKKMQAQQQLYREHNFNPLGGCLLAFVQLPIFVGLYRGLSVDVALRQAPLFSESVRWASNLAAPDMLWNWTSVMPSFITEGTGFFVLGPYFNILPLVTVGLFLWQQKMFMPPPADEQARLQQKMMQYMMLFMGLLFFKVASGLCVYFIASSAWGIAERKLLPKANPQSAQAGTATTTSMPSPVASGATGTSGNGAASKKKKRQRGRK